MGPMNRIYRYMMRQLAWPLVTAVLVIAGIVWMSQSLRFVDLVLNRGLPASTLFQLAFLVLPMYTSVLLPIVLFGTVAFTYSRMILDSELVVWRTCGLSHFALAGPALILSGLVLLISYALNLYYMPLAYRNFKDLQHAIRYNYSQVLLREGVFNEIGKGMTVYVRERAPNGELLGILIHDRRESGPPVTMMAERGALVQTNEGPRVVMVNGNRQIVKGPREELSILYFDRYTLDLDTTEDIPGPRWREPRERFIHELFRAPTTGPHAATNARSRLKLLAEGHQRLVAPWLAPSFVLIVMVALLTGDFNRRGQTRRLVGASTAMVLVQAGNVSLHSLAGTDETVVPFMYLLPASVIIACVWLLMRQRRRSPFAIKRTTPGASAT